MINRPIFVKCVLAVTAGVISFGCATAQPPRGTLSQANLAVQDAAEGKAPQYAPLELRQAREKLAQARKAMAQEDYTGARRLAEQALVDAQLAREKAAAESTRQSAAQLARSIEALRDEALR